MTGSAEGRWDDAVEAAWVRFRQQLADRLVELDDGDVFLVQVPDDEELDGAAPYCQVAADEGWLRVEAVSNEFLAESCSLDSEREADMGRLGFRPPDDDESPNFWIDLEQREADRAAVMVVRALREVYGVLHPVYLDAEGLEPQAVREPAPAEPSPTTGTQPEAGPVFPRTADEVRAALDAVVEPLVGHAPEWDEDGDLPLLTERGVFYVTVAGGLPRILLHATLLVDVVDEQRALVEVNLLNKHEFGLTFLFLDGRIQVRRELPVGAFVPGEIRGELQRFNQHLDGWIGDLQARVGGRGPLEHDAARPPQGAQPPTAPTMEDTRFDAAMRVLRELEGEERGSVDPATMVRIFHGDRDLLLAAIRDTQRRATKWGTQLRKAEREGKTAVPRVARAQQRYHLELRSRLRRALRLAVQAPGRRDDEQLTLFAEDEAAT